MLLNNIKSVTEKKKTQCIYTIRTKMIQFCIQCTKYV